MFSDINQINKILNDIWNLNLVLLGIALTLFTLLYSFILSKRDSLMDIVDVIKQQGKYPEASRKKQIASNYIRRLQKVNDKIIRIIIITFVLSVLGWVSERIIPDYSFWYTIKLWCYRMLSVTSILILIYLICMFCKIYSNYKKTTPIE